MKKKFRIKSFINYIILLLLVCFVGFPLLWMFVSSIKPATELFVRPPSIFPRVISFEWYKVIFMRTNAPRWFMNSFLIAFITMVLNIVISTLASYSIVRFKYPGRHVFIFGSLIGYVFPAILLLVPIYILINRLNLVGTYAGVIIPHLIQTLPFSIWLLRSFYSMIPKDLEEAAMLDGASNFGAFIRITLPLAAPGVLSTALFAFILSWNEYLFASVIATNDSVKTLPVGISTFIASFDIRWGEIMALGTITTIPVIIFFGIMQKYFVKGIIAGALKE